MAQVVSRRPHHRGSPGSRPGQSMWDLWLTKWHWERFFSEFFGFPLSISFHRRSPNSYHLGNVEYANVKSRHPGLGTRPTPPSGKKTVSGYRLDDRAIDVRSPAEAREFFL
jgi:hypothetical protein